MDAVWCLCVVFVWMRWFPIFAYVADDDVNRWRCLSVGILDAHFKRGDKENSVDSFSVSITVAIQCVRTIRAILTMQFLKKFSLFRFQNKSSSGGNHVPTKSPLTLDSDISGIDGKEWIIIFILLKFSFSNKHFYTSADNTLSSGFDTTIDTSYKIENANATFGDLINGFGGLQLNTPKREYLK